MHHFSPVLRFCRLQKRRQRLGFFQIIKATAQQNT